MIERLNYGGRLDDGARLAGALAEAGLSLPAARSKAALLARAAGQLAPRQGGSSAEPMRAFYVPGRIEVLGKHTDYAGGASLLAAAERGFCLAARPRDDRRITVTDALAGETVAFAFDADLVPRARHWSNYPMTVARRVARNFPSARRGLEVAFASDLPSAAGMSSSSAMLVAMFLAVAEVNGLWSAAELTRNMADRIALAAYLATVENGQTFGTLEGDRGVGTAGGSEDHTAILCCRPASLSEYAYCPVRFQRQVLMPRGHMFAVGCCGVVAEKTGAAMARYNRASRLAAVAGEIWRRETGRSDPHLAAVLASSADAADRMRQVLAGSTIEGTEFSREDVARRFEHFCRENAVLRPAGDALARGDLEAFGRGVDQSQRAAEELLGNQIAQTSWLAASARRQGAAAATAFGAGFGGSVWAMVEADRAAAFLQTWAAGYRQRFPRHAETSRFFLTGAGPAAVQVC